MVLLRYSDDDRKTILSKAYVQWFKDIMDERRAWSIAAYANKNAEHVKDFSTQEGKTNIGAKLAVGGATGLSAGTALNFCVGIDDYRQRRQWEDNRRTIGGRGEGATHRGLESPGKMSLWPISSGTTYDDYCGPICNRLITMRVCDHHVLEERAGVRDRLFQYVALRKEELQADGQQTGVWIWVLDIGGETRGDARIAQQRIPGDISCSGSVRRMDMEADEARFRTMQASSSIREQAMRDLNTFRTLIDLINEARARGICCPGDERSAAIAGWT